MLKQRYNQPFHYAIVVLTVMSKKGKGRESEWREKIEEEKKEGREGSKEGKKKEKMKRGAKGRENRMERRKDENRI